MVIDNSRCNVLGARNMLLRIFNKKKNEMGERELLLAPTNTRFNLQTLNIVKFCELFFIHGSKFNLYSNLIYIILYNSTFLSRILPIFFFPIVLIKLKS